MKHLSKSTALETTSGLTLAHLLEMTEAFKVSPQARQNMTSAINSFCRVIDRAPQLVPAHVPTLRKLMAQASPGAAGLSMTRWRNVKTSINRALRLAGLIANNSSAQAALSDAWESVAAKAPTATERAVLRRFGRFCDGRRLMPDGVNDAALEDYLCHLDANQLSKTPLRTVKDVIRIWNRLANKEAMISPLTERKEVRSYVLAWSDLPEGLAADARRFYECSQKPDWFDSDDGRRAVRQTTADQRDRMLRRLASAALLAGVSPDQMSSLARLITPDNLRRGLEFMLERNGGKPNRQLFEMTLLAQTIARHWSALPDSEIATIAKWTKRFRPTQRGMTEKNRERLRQFSGPTSIGALVGLSEKVFAALEKRPVTQSGARRAQRALMVAILTVAPMRLKNLRSLDRERHFRRAFSVDADRWHLVLTADEVKNAIDLEFPVPPHVLSMIDRYMEVYQPRLSRTATSLLFPGRKSGTMTDSGMRQALSGFVRKELGLAMNPHLFRHLDALIFLKVNPGQYESVRQLLGHKNIQTTTEYYAGFETGEAMERYASILTDYRDTSDLQRRES